MNFIRFRHSDLSVPKKFSIDELSYGHPLLDIEGRKWYAWLRWEYTFEAYCDPWSLWRTSPSVTFSCFRASACIRSSIHSFRSVVSSTASFRAGLPFLRSVYPRSASRIFRFRRVTRFFTCSAVRVYDSTICRFVSPACFRRKISADKCSSLV